MEWSGEEGERWLYLVKDGKLFVSGETRNWDEPEPYKYLHYDFHTDADGKMVTDTKVIDIYAPMPEDLVSRWDKKKKVEA